MTPRPRRSAPSISAIDTENGTPFRDPQIADANPATGDRTPELPGAPYRDLAPAFVGHAVARRTLAALALSSPADPVEEAHVAAMAGLVVVALALLALAPWVAPLTWAAGVAWLGGAS